MPRMKMPETRAIISLTLMVGCALAGCARQAPSRGPVASAAEIDCMARAMYFESNRSSRDGMIAVGSVVMNRVASEDFPGDVCAVRDSCNNPDPGLAAERYDDALTGHR